MRASVIIPCHNGARTVAEAVHSALAQTLPPHEVIVVDDGSTDGSGDVARRAGARVVESSARSSGGSRNVGIKAASGDALAFLDCDAVVSGNWLERTATHFGRDARILAVGARITNGRPDRFGELDYFLNHSEWMGRKPGPRPTFPTMAVVYRRDAVAKVRFPEASYGEDTTFARTVLADHGVVWFDPEITITHYHERLDWASFWDKQVNNGRSLYWTRVRLDRPGRILVRFPVLLFLFPHLWLVLARMLRAGQGGRAVALFPWLVAGEIARIRGFLDARRDARRRSS
ncbi:MAG TPA: glycosyltransferase family 2 protein [Thermoanaerobaculaceae bacterium]|nr:glycosyltransferase family 2 protein [Thermoanaerobaculaceae bacterium]